MAIKNTIRNLVRPSYFPVMTRKVISRFTELKHKQNKNAAKVWCREYAQDYGDLIFKLDRELWYESKEFSRNLKLEADKKIEQLGVNLGGGGNYTFLYFITRWLKPETIVETGVAAGYSTKAILEAIRKNGKGRLYSSDFPYFRLNKPEKYIGILVDDHLRDNWELFIEGDQKNLGKITNKVQKIDLFHYDSDKTYAGRDLALKILSPYITPQSVIIMDDIQDNLFFKDYVERNQLPFKIFYFENKYLGVTGI